MICRQKTLALIPARGGSKGIVKKNIKAIAGKPLIAWTLQAALGCPAIDRIIVSTDDEQIRTTACLYGAEVPFLRPMDCAGDHSPMIDVIQHMLDWLKSSDQEIPDKVVLLQPTSPMRTAEDIDTALKLVDERHSVVSVCKVPSHLGPSWQLVLNGENICRQYSGDCLSKVVTRRQDLPDTYIRNGAIYAFSVAMFENTGSFYGKQPRAYVMPESKSINIDEISDWLTAEKALTLRLSQKDKAD